MNEQKHSLVAYLATLGAIVLLAVSASVICLVADLSNETQIAKLLAALGFISSGVTGLVGVIGTFRPRAATPDSTGGGGA